MKYVIDPPRQAALPVRGSSELFPIHRIYCIGRNYAEHAREMGHDPNKEPPFFFQKNPDNLRTDGKFPYPPGTSDVHFEIEMIVALKSGGRDIKPEDALAHVWGYGVGLDMTRRDLQGEAKKMGRPWEMGKAFDNSAPCSALKPVSMVGHPAKGAIWLKVNGKTTQQGDLSISTDAGPECSRIAPAARSSRGGMPSLDRNPCMCAAGAFRGAPASTTAPRRRARASTSAALSPAAPPPTTTTS